MVKRHRVKRQTVKRQTVKRQTVKRQTVKRQTVKNATKGQTTNGQIDKILNINIIIFLTFNRENRQNWYKGVIDTKVFRHL